MLRIGAATLLVACTSASDDVFEHSFGYAVENRTHEGVRQYRIRSSFGRAALPIVETTCQEEQSPYVVKVLEERGRSDDRNRCVDIIGDIRRVERDMDLGLSGIDLTIYHVERGYTHRSDWNEFGPAPVIEMVTSASLDSGENRHAFVAALYNELYHVTRGRLPQGLRFSGWNYVTEEAASSIVERCALGVLTGAFEYGEFERSSIAENAAKIRGVEFRNSVLTARDWRRPRVQELMYLLLPDLIIERWYAREGENADPTPLCRGVVEDHEAVFEGLGITPEGVRVD